MAERKLQTRLPIYGYHASTHQGYLAAVEKSIGFDAFATQIWLGNSKGYASKLIPEKEYEPVAKFVVENNFFLISHSPYILNFARPLQETEAGRKALDRYLRDLINITNLGGFGSVLHMGFNVKELNQTTEQCYKTFINNLQWIADRMPDQATIILENMAGKGTSMCCWMDQWATFWQQIPGKLRKRIKWCIDTAHLYATGEYDISKRREVLRFYKDFDQKIGWRNVGVIHFNGSKSKLSSKYDNHADIGPEDSGYIQSKGLRQFARIAGATKVPLILETPCDEWNILEQFETIQSWFARTVARRGGEQSSPERGSA